MIDHSISTKINCDMSKYSFVVDWSGKIGDTPKSLQDLSPESIKSILERLGQDRNWLATYLFCATSTVNGWLSAGKEIPKARLMQMQSIFFMEYMKQAEEEQRNAEFHIDSENENNNANEYFHIIPPNKNIRALWEAVFPKVLTEFSTLSEVQFDRILNLSAKATLKNKLGNIKIRDIELSPMPIFSEAEKKSSMNYYHQRYCYTWRLAASLENKTLKQWCNDVLTDYAEESLFL